MADNIVLNTGSGGDTLAADDISSVKYQRVKLVIGADGTNDGDVSQNNALPVVNEFSQIAAGLVASKSIVNKFGRNSDVDNTAPEDLWEGGGTWVAPTTDRLHDIASTDANDTSAGTGARTVEVSGLVSGVETTETVTMNGTSNVATVNAFEIIHRMRVLTAGSGGENAGNISATAQTDATVSALMLAGNNQTTLAIYKVPDGKTALLHHWYGSMARGTAGFGYVEIFAQAEGSVFQLKRSRALDSSGSNTFSETLPLPIAFAAGTTIKLRAEVEQNNTEVDGGFDLLLQ